MTALRVQSLTKTYRRGDEIIYAVNDCFLNIEYGEYIAVTGPSGSGKSTLLHLLAALDRPDSGRIEICGKDISKMSDDELAQIRREKIGFVFQNFNLLGGLTARENIIVPALLSGKKPDHKKVGEITEMLLISDRLSHYPSELSGGQTQRVAIARALINDPDIILADEPTGNLDSETSAEIMKLFDELHDSGKTVVIVTHDEAVAGHCRRRIVIMDGKIGKDYSDMEKLQ
ncbi:MAG: ABC transporter ATP-binding protein [Clostridia bacterium]|nr:ABC transporter ATP-binding protein [Clostridia bacterium]